MIFIGLGSSIGNSAEIFSQTQEYLEKNEINIVKKSKILRNKPYGGIAKNQFSNAVWQISLNNKITPHQLLLILKRGEAELGRDFSAEKWADRIIDLDILMFNKQIISTETLTIPHIEIPRRIFVLAPWMELVSANFKIPKFGNLANIIKKLKTNNTKL